MMLLFVRLMHFSLYLCGFVLQDFDAMAELVNPKNIPAAQQAELEAYLREVGLSTKSRTHSLISYCNLDLSWSVTAL